MTNLQLLFQCENLYSLALEQCKLPLVQVLKIQNQGAEPLVGLQMAIGLYPNFGQPDIYELLTLHGGDQIDLTEKIPLKLPIGRIQEVIEDEEIVVRCQIFQDEAVLQTTECSVKLLAYNTMHWNRQRVYACFVTPNHPVIAGVLKETSKTLIAKGKNGSLEGYQSSDPERIEEIVQALYETFANLDISYIDPPAGGWGEGQRIRMPDQVLAEKLGTCADLAPLAASCLEQIGLHPVIVFVDGHVFQGLFLNEDRARHQPTLIEDISTIYNLIEARELLLFDSSSYALKPQPPFKMAAETAKNYLSTFKLLLNIYNARMEGYRPLPIRMNVVPPSAGEVLSLAQQILLRAAKPTTADLPVEESPILEPVDLVAINRFQRWKERLLDLSLRNRLLHLSNLDFIHLFTSTFASITRTVLIDLGVSIAEEEPELCSALHSLADGLKSDRLIPQGFCFDKQFEEQIYYSHLIASLPQGLRQICDQKLSENIDWLDDLREQVGAKLIKNLASRKASFLALHLPTGLLGNFEDLISRNRSIELLGDGIVSDNDDGIAIAAQELANGCCRAVPAIGYPKAFSSSLLFQIGRTLSREARITEEETGFSPLYLAFGFLQWTEKKSGTFRLAPLVLYPIEITVDVRQQRVRIQRSKSEPVGNITLVEKLRQDYDLHLNILESLPEDDNGIDIAKVLQQTRQAIVNHSGWRVIESAVITTFDFGKFLLWRDLQDHTQLLLQNPLVRHIATAGRESFPDPLPELDPKDLDQHPYQDLPLVVQNDSSQLAAVYAAIKGRSFVLQGPPGTGKSQTITNMIAAAIAAGKTVLFVAEKAAAVEVVLKRLKSVGLNPFCLDLHGTDGNHDEVLKSLAESLEQQLETNANWENICEELNQIRKQLRLYTNALHQPRGIGFSLFDMLGEINKSRNLPNLPLELKPTELNANTFRNQLKQIRDFVRVIPQESDISNNIWQFVGDVKWSLSLEQKLLAVLDEVILALEALIQTFEILALSPNTWQKCCDLLPISMLQPFTDLPHGIENSENWEQIFQKSKFWLEQSHKLTELDRQLRQKWHDTILKQDPEPLIQRVKKLQNAFFLVRWISTFFLKRELQSLSRTPLKSLTHILKDLCQIKDSRNHKKELQRDWSSLKSYLPNWNGKSDSLSQLIQHYQSIHELLHKFSTQGFNWEQLIALPTENWQGFSDQIQQVQEQFQNLAQTLELTNFPTIDQQQKSPQTILEWFKNLRSQYPSLRHWMMYKQLRSEFASLPMGSLLDWCNANQIPLSNLEETYRAIVLKQWFISCFDAEPILQNFKGDRHNNLLERFRNLEKEYIETSQHFVRQQVIGRMPNRGLNINGSEVAELKREIAKKSRRIPLRTLFRRIPNLFSSLKPCLLASPISVAQFLPADGRKFDLVIFDEASQVETHDAIGAIARGQQIVIVGDNKQMPPTNFFGSSNSDNDTLPEDSIEDLESILDEAMACAFPEQMLQWHYRSRHESLIEFSNSRYYEGRLQLFPSAQRIHPNLGVHWHSVPQGYYQTGDRVNRKEAEDLVAYLIDRLEKCHYKERSFGVITFSTPQQFLIEQLLQQARQQKPELEVWFNNENEEKCFIKNLETVQGDERDEILFSICYAPQQNGYMSMALGPLNRKGSERRLNVAVTRARSALHVFSTLTPEHIDLSRISSNALAVRHLREFLIYAKQQGNEASRPLRRNDFDSNVHRQVYEVLTEVGYQVDCKVGCAAYRIDLAILDPSDPSSYCIGIECDGASYSATATVRDRDYSRPAVLAGMGWQMYRVWSVDWLLDYEGAKQRLLEAVKQATEKVKIHSKDGLTSSVKKAVQESVIKQYSSSVLPVEPASLHKSTELNLGRPYTRANLEQVSDKFQEFYSNDAITLIIERLDYLLSIEAPINLYEAGKRVAQCWNCNNYTQRARTHVTQIVNQSSFYLEDDFIWHSLSQKQGWKGFRIAPPDGRNVSQIAAIEIHEALILLTQSALSISPDDLIKEVYRQLTGANRLTGVQKQHLEDLLQDLLDRKIIGSQDNRLFYPALP